MVLLSVCQSQWVHVSVLWKWRLVDYALSRNQKVGWPNNYWQKHQLVEKEIVHVQDSKFSHLHYKEKVVSDSWPPGMAMLANVSHLLIAVNSAINIIVYAIKVIFQMLIMKGFGLRHQISISVQMSSNEKMTRKLIHRCTRLICITCFTSFFFVASPSNSSIAPKHEYNNDCFY